jgi:hypothetical protein
MLNTRSVAAKYSILTYVCVVISKIQWMPSSRRRTQQFAAASVEQTVSKNSYTFSWYARKISKRAGLACYDHVLRTNEIESTSSTYKVANLIRFFPESSRVDWLAPVPNSYRSYANTCLFP